jgi:serine/threonine protein phosphatase PrpC
LVLSFYWSCGTFGISPADYRILTDTLLPPFPHSMNMLLIAGQTDVGQRRTDNQDTFICKPVWSDTTALLAAIDGVGGYAGGDRAAALAKESIEKYMATPNGDPLSMLREAVVFANNQINDARLADRKLAQMCCVLTSALVDVGQNKLHYVHVGDTRLYRFRQGTLEKITRDHSMVGIREDANELTEEEAMNHPRRNEIMREVGSMEHRVDDTDFLESGDTDFLPGDVLLLCSDGLTDMITQRQIISVLSQTISLDKQTTELIRLANRQGGKDNITVVLARHNAPPLAAGPVAAGAGERVSAVKEPVRVVAPAESVSVPPVQAEPKKRSMAGVWVLCLLIGLAVVGAIVWYQFQRPEKMQVITDSLATTEPTVDSLASAPANARLDSLLRVAYRSADHRLVLPADTVRLTQPIILSDSLQTIVGDSRLTVIMPADSVRTPAALRLSRRGLVKLENLVFQGFQTGVESAGEGKLYLTKVYFKNVGTPLNAAIRQDSSRNTVITISVQDLPVSPQTPHP